VSEQRDEDRTAGSTAATPAQVGPAPAAPTARATVGIAIEDVALHQEVLDLVSREPGLEVVGAVSEGERVARLLVDAIPRVMVVSPGMVAYLRHPALADLRPDVVVVSQALSIDVLREAIHGGASGVFVWPEERHDLVESLVGLAGRGVEEPSRRGRVIAVLGARGGAGTTFLVTHLAAAFATLGRRPAVVDLDVASADVTAACGVDSEAGPRTVEDLVAVRDELSPDHLENALVRHAAGFAALLAPRSTADDPGTGLYAGAIALLAASYDPVLLHLPRGHQPAARAGLDIADAILLVTTLDLFSLYGARRTLARLGPEQAAKCRLVVNRATRSAVTVRDIERVVGVGNAALVRADSRVVRVQERGDLLTGRLRGAWRDVVVLARSLDQAVAPPGAEARA
jgi:pilus assembly protein CpaE